MEGCLISLIPVRGCSAHAYAQSIGVEVSNEESCYFYMACRDWMATNLRQKEGKQATNRKLGLTAMRRKRAAVMLRIITIAGDSMSEEITMSL